MRAELLVAVLALASHQPATTRFARSKLAIRDSSPFVAVLEVDGAVLERLLANGDAERAADQVGVGELLARAQLDGRRGGRRGPPPTALAATCSPNVDELGVVPAEHDDVDVVRRDLPRPDHPVLAPVLLDRRREHASGADPVGAHHDRLLDPVLVRVLGAEGLRVRGAELEDVTDLDRRLEAEPCRRRSGRRRPPSAGGCPRTRAR